jgi:hypothetical protein
MQQCYMPTAAGEITIRQPQVEKMSVDERFSDVDWEELLYKLTARARQPFAAAKARGYQ